MAKTLTDLLVELAQQQQTLQDLVTNKTPIAATRRTIEDVNGELTRIRTEIATLMPTGPRLFAAFQIPAPDTDGGFMQYSKMEFSVNGTEADFKAGTPDVVMTLQPAIEGMAEVARAVVAQTWKMGKEMKAKKAEQARAHACGRPVPTW